MLACQYMAAILLLASKTALFACPLGSLSLHRDRRCTRCLAVRKWKDSLLLFPIGDLGPPEGPEVPDRGLCRRVRRRWGHCTSSSLAMAGLAALFVKVHANAQVASMDTTDE